MCAVVNALLLRRVRNRILPGGGGKASAVAGRAGHLVSSGPPQDAIVPGTRADPVLPAERVDHIVTVEGQDHVATGRSDEDVGAGGPPDRPRLPDAGQPGGVRQAYPPHDPSGPRGGGYPPGGGPPPRYPAGSRLG